MTQSIFRSAAAQDIARAYAWYERQRVGLGEDFLGQVAAAAEAALANREAYPVLHRETRRVLVNRFPYGLLYRIVGDVAVFVGCFHTSRRPASWKRRK
jgi:plasmid stabilization system protein ParE